MHLEKYNTDINTKYRDLEIAYIKDINEIKIQNSTLLADINEFTDRIESLKSQLNEAENSQLL